MLAAAQLAGVGQEHFHGSLEGVIAAQGSDDGVGIREVGTSER